METRYTELNVLVTLDYIYIYIYIRSVRYDQVPGGSAAFPMTADGRCVDLRVFSCLQVSQPPVRHFYFHNFLEITSKKSNCASLVSSCDQELEVTGFKSVPFSGPRGCRGTLGMALILNTVVSLVEA